MMLSTPDHCPSSLIELASAKSHNNHDNILRDMTASYATVPGPMPTPWPYGGRLSTASPNPDIRIELENVDLWRKFHQHTNEMILTKSGRRMFPSLRFRLSGLDPSANYSVMLEFVSADDCRYKFQRGSWIVNGRADATDATLRSVVHPDSACAGAHWMKQSITFCRLKLTNHLTDTNNQDQVLLNSMHKYVPRLYVIRVDNDHYPSNLPNAFPFKQQVVCATSFPETAFVAVTAYQNDAIIKLKIDNNPFAKGFRDNATAAKRSITPNNHCTDVPAKRVKLSPSVDSHPSPKSPGSSSSSSVTPSVPSPSTSSKDQSMSKDSATSAFSPLPSPVNPLFAGLYSNLYSNPMAAAFGLPVFPHGFSGSPGFFPWSMHMPVTPQQNPFAAGIPFPWLSSLTQPQPNAN